MRHRFLKCSIILVAVCVLPSIAYACDEECYGVYNYLGELVGYGCGSGNDGFNCRATVEDCEIDYCGAPVAILTGSGLSAEVARFCAAPEVEGEHVHELMEGERPAKEGSQVGSSPMILDLRQVGTTW